MEKKRHSRHKIPYDGTQLNVRLQEKTLNALKKYAIDAKVTVSEAAESALETFLAAPLVIGKKPLRADVSPETVERHAKATADMIARSKKFVHSGTGKLLDESLKNAQELIDGQ